MSVVEALGFRPEHQVVVVHVDDIGMSQAANEGALLALEGAATCGSIMVPCPGFDEIAEIARSRPELDLGVHLTLNAEYESYRWPPLRDDVPGLVSPDGGMWRSTQQTTAHASPEEVERELRAQIQTALDAGIDVSHLDSHMGTVLEPKFIETYLQLARDFELPVFIPRIGRAVRERIGDGERLQLYTKLMAQIETSGLPVFDSFCADSLSFEPGTGHEHNRRRLERLGPGLNYLITHCARGNDQLQGITADWRQRDEERRIYSDGTMARELEEREMHTIGMRPLRELVRGSKGDD
ncbi:MAG: polysaccharide deacetylase family protein [Myxococcota bacterium]